MHLFLQIILLVLGFVLLIKGADWFVDGAAGIANKLGIPQLVIGLTIVAMGTSAPEAAVSISSALKGSADIAVGNVIGSNILNILLILGITGVIVPLAVRKSTIRYELPFVIGVSGIFAILGLSDGVIGRVNGIILWVIFIGYLLYLLIMTKKGNDMMEEAPAGKQRKPWQLVLFLIIGVVMIVVGSNITVDSATEIARIFGVSERLIGLTIVAFGTSLPELVTCVAAARKGNADIAIGNIVGSNIFNILFVIGTSALITPVLYQRNFFIDSIVMIATAILLLVLVLNRNRELKRWGGVVMLVVYTAYFMYLIMK